MRVAFASSPFLPPPLVADGIPQGKYVEADIAKNRLEELKIHEENRRKVRCYLAGVGGVSPSPPFSVVLVPEGKLYLPF